MENEHVLKTQTCRSNGGRGRVKSMDRELQKCHRKWNYAPVAVHTHTHPNFCNVCIIFLITCIFSESFEKKISDTNSMGYSIPPSSVNRIMKRQQIIVLFWESLDQWIPTGERAGPASGALGDKWSAFAHHGDWGVSPTCCKQRPKEMPERGQLHPGKARAISSARGIPTGKHGAPWWKLPLPWPSLLCRWT